jgi:hypothetical protein
MKNRSTSPANYYLHKYRQVGGMNMDRGGFAQWPCPIPSSLSSLPLPTPRHVARNASRAHVRVACVYDGVTAGGAVNAYAAQSFAEHTIEWLLRHHQRFQQLVGAQKGIARGQALTSLTSGLTTLANEVFLHCQNPSLIRPDFDSLGGAAPGVFSISFPHPWLPGVSVICGAAIGDACALLLTRDRKKKLIMTATPRASGTPVGPSSRASPSSRTSSPNRSGTTREARPLRNGATGTPTATTVASGTLTKDGRATGPGNSSSAPPSLSPHSTEVKSRSLTHHDTFPTQPSVIRAVSSPHLDLPDDSPTPSLTPSDVPLSSGNGGWSNGPPIINSDWRAHQLNHVARRGGSVRDTGGQVEAGSHTLNGNVSVFFHTEVHDDDLMLLCTDGLTDNMLPSDINRLIPLIISMPIFDKPVPLSAPWCTAGLPANPPPLPSAMVISLDHVTAADPSSIQATPLPSMNNKTIGGDGIPGRQWSSHLPPSEELLYFFWDAIRNNTACGCMIPATPIPSDSSSSSSSSPASTPPLIPENTVSSTSIPSPLLISQTVPSSSSTPPSPLPTNNVPLSPLSTSSSLSTSTISSTIVAAPMGSPERPQARTMSGNIIFHDRRLGSGNNAAAVAAAIAAAAPPSLSSNSNQTTMTIAIDGRPSPLPIPSPPASPIPPISAGASPSNAATLASSSSSSSSSPSPSLTPTSTVDGGPLSSFRRSLSESTSSTTPAPSAFASALHATLARMGPEVAEATATIIRQHIRIDPLKCNGICKWATLPLQALEYVTPPQATLRLSNYIE